MKTNRNRNRWLLPVGSAIAASVVAAGIWFAVSAVMPGPAIGEGTVVHLSMQVYSTLDDLSDAADAVVLGTVKNHTASVVSGGKKGENGGEYPYNVYEFDVIESFKGEASGTIYIVRTDASFLAEAAGFNDYPLTPLNTGETVVLYLDTIDANLLPEIVLDGTLHVPIGMDNGVFDVVGADTMGPVGRVDDETGVIPRGVAPSMFGEGSTFTAADIRQAIEPEPGEPGGEGQVGSTKLAGGSFDRAGAVTL